MIEEFGSIERRRVLKIIIAAGFVILLSRLFQLQYIYGDVYGKEAEENSIRNVPKVPIRGYIYDRKGTLLVDNRPSYTVMITPVDFDRNNLPLLSSILAMPEEDITLKLKQAQRYNPFIPARIKRDISFAELSMLEEHHDKLYGVEIQMESKRFYPAVARGSHMFGYAKEISDAQLEKNKEYYQPGDLIGSAGLESKYEQQLRGVKGWEFISQNAKGQIIGTFDNGKHDIPPQDGFDLQLAIDADVQALAESLLSDKRGAVVAIDPRNGGIIAMVSKPDYDLSHFSGVTPPDVWRSLNNDPDKPLFNRATLTRYPPGSTFKMLLALTALEKGIIDENWRVTCYGAYRYGNKLFRCEHVHGSVDVVDAIHRSCNVFFYQLMLKVGLDDWSEIGKQFGFGKPTKVDIMEENAGLLPTREYYDRVHGKGKWTQGYLISLGIGQGEVGVTPLQMANYAAILANKGTHFQPHVVNSVYDRRTKKAESVPVEQYSFTMSEKAWGLVREGMHRVVMAPHGTGTAARIPGIEVAGKTGTAQNPHGKAHSWFIGFAPYDEPKIAICVLIENVGYGGSFAAPAAGLCMEQYLYGEIIRYGVKKKTADETMATN
ncbi:MAG: penicillin-binding protein 2 [Ignavibacteriales bacterium]|nr:penicillin-binding protein 2 [Ignavibacteriales bacterium]